MADELIENAEYGRNKNEEEPPILIAQRFLNIYRQMHIFNRDRQEQFNDMLLEMKPEVRILLSTLPGGGLLLEHIAETETKRGVSSSSSVKQNLRKRESNLPDSSVGTGDHRDENRSGGGGVIIDASFANELSSSLSMALQQNEKRYKEDMKVLTETLTHSIMESQTIMLGMMRDILVATKSTDKNFTDTKNDKNNFKAITYPQFATPASEHKIIDTNTGKNIQNKFNNNKSSSSEHVNKPNAAPQPAQPKPQETKPVVNEPIVKITPPDVKPNVNVAPQPAQPKPQIKPNAPIKPLPPAALAKHLNQNNDFSSASILNSNNVNNVAEAKKNEEVSNILQNTETNKNKEISNTSQSEIKSIYQDELNKIKFAIETDMNEEVSLDDFGSAPVSLDADSFDNKPISLDAYGFDNKPISLDTDSFDFKPFITDNDNNSNNISLIQENTFEENQSILSPMDLLSDTDTDDWEWEYVEDDSDADEWEWEYVEDDADSDEWEWEYIEDDTDDKNKKN